MMCRDGKKFENHWVRVMSLLMDETENIIFIVLLSEKGKRTKIRVPLNF